MAPCSAGGAGRRRTPTAAAHETEWPQQREKSVHGHCWLRSRTIREALGTPDSCSCGSKTYKATTAQSSKGSDLKPSRQRPQAHKIDTTPVTSDRHRLRICNVTMLRAHREDQHLLQRRPATTVPQMSQLPISASLVGRGTGGTSFERSRSNRREIHNQYLSIRNSRFCPARFGAGWAARPLSCMQLDLNEFSTSASASTQPGSHARF